MKGLMLLFYIVFFHICCGDSNPLLLDFKEVNNILIINRAPNNYIEDSTLLSDISSINEFCDLYNEKKEITGYPNVKSNFGFFEMIVTLKSGE